MKIVIVGDGKVGHALSEQLSSEGHDIVVVENRPDKTRFSDTRLDVVAVRGNGASIAVQKEAGVEEADILIAATSADELNILCCMVAKKLGAKHTIARVRNPEYADQLRLLRTELGLSMSINPEMAAAREISRVLAFPSASKIETFGKGRIELCEIKLGEDSPLHNLRLSKLYNKYRLRVLICAVQRGEKVSIPSGDFELKRGDVIYVTAQRDQLTEFCRAIGIMTRRIRSVMIVGGSRIAYYLTKILTGAGMQVKIVERDHERCLSLYEAFPKALIVEGDGSDYELLVEEGIKESDAFVTLTGNDEENILLSIFARSHGVPKVVTKVNRGGLSAISAQLGLTSVISPKEITTSDIVQYVRALHNSEGSNVETLHRIVGGRVEALEFRVKSDFHHTGIPLKELRLKRELLVACIMRQDRVIIPGGEDTFELGDSVVVVTTRQYMDDIKDILAESRNENDQDAGREKRT